MRCPFCGCYESAVKICWFVDSKLSMIRRRECEYCNKRYTTVEMVKESKNDKQPKQAHSKPREVL